MSLKINEQEQIIFDMILNCRPQDVVPRVAGGWVRDKIMGVDSYDMDIALNNISGYKFAKILEQSFKESVSRVSIIQSNPDKSKHLETAVCRINNIFVDFVNLRSEIYENSRIPIIKTGTAEEDAFRRDLTINALFYNLVTKKIEDYTKYGLQDIANKILRTPLDPLVTFSEDPLRILRLFRFMSMLDFEIDIKTREALKNKDLQILLKNKVSKERIQSELFKTINCNFGYKGIFELIYNNFVESVFGLKVNYDNLHKIYNLLKNRPEKCKMWIINLYIILLESSAVLIKDIKNRSFLNVVVIRKNLCCSSKIINAIKEIEEGIFICKKFDFFDLSTYNISLILILLKTHVLEILYLSFVKTNKQEIYALFSYLCKNKEKFIFGKPEIEVKDINIKLKIEVKYTKFIVQEIQIFQFSYPNKNVMEHLLVNKNEIIDKFSKFTVPYKVNE